MSSSHSQCPCVLKQPLHVSFWTWWLPTVPTRRFATSLPCLQVFDGVLICTVCNGKLHMICVTKPWAFTRLYIEHSMLFLFSPYQLTTMCIRTSGNQTLPERSEPRPKTCQVHVPHQGIEPSLSNAAKTALDWGYQTCTWCVRHALNENTSSSVWLQLENLVGQDVEFRFAKVAEGRSWDVGECTK